MSLTILVLLLLQNPEAASNPKKDATKSFAHRLGDRRALVARAGGSDATEKAVLLALKWLARHQNEDGSWSKVDYSDRCGRIERYAGKCVPTGVHPAAKMERRSHPVGISGVALLAFLGAGYTHSSKESYDGINFGDVVRRGLEFLQKAQDRDGCIGSRKYPQYMYDHTIAALAFCEAYGLTQSRKIKSNAQNAIDFIIAAQTKGKGWRYATKAGESDSSVTGWAVMALRAGELAGLTFDRKPSYGGARAWFDQVAFRTSAGAWKAGYQSGTDAVVQIPGINDQWNHHPTMTAISVMCRLLMGQNRDGEKVIGGATVLLEDPPNWEPVNIDFYYWYMASMALYQYAGPAGPVVQAPDVAKKARELIRDLGSDDVEKREAATQKLKRLGIGAKGELQKAEKNGDLEVAVRARAVLAAIDSWRWWSKSMTRTLVRNQITDPDHDKNGSWPPVGRWCCMGGRVYATAINTLTLETYYRYLPTLER